MKIIKPGKIEQEFWWLGKQFDCKWCGCQFELEKRDYYLNDPIFIVKCPTCKECLRVIRPRIPDSPCRIQPVVKHRTSEDKLREILYGDAFHELTSIS